MLNQTGDEVTLKFELESGKSLQVQMNPSVLQVMLALLDKLQGLAQWGVGFDEMAALPVLGTEATPSVH